MATITVNGVRLAYDDAGSGPPVVWCTADVRAQRTHVARRRHPRPVVSLPVLLPGVGHADPVLAAVDARLAGALPHARRHTLVDAGHVPHLTRPGEFVRVGLAFLDDVTSSIAGGQPKEH